MRSCVLIRSQFPLRRNEAVVGLAVVTAAAGGGDYAAKAGGIGRGGGVSCDAYSGEVGFIYEVVPVETARKESLELVAQGLGCMPIYQDKRGPDCKGTGTRQDEWMFFAAGNVAGVEQLGGRYGNEVWMKGGLHGEKSNGRAQEGEKKGGGFISQYRVR